MLPLNLSDTAATSQDGSSLEFIAAIAGRQCYIQDASGRGLCIETNQSSADTRQLREKVLNRYNNQIMIVPRNL